MAAPFFSPRLSRSRAGVVLILLTACLGPESVGPSRPDLPFEVLQPTAAAAPTNFWVTQAPMRSRRSGLAAAAVNGLVYAIGGFGADPGFPASTLASVEAFNSGTNSWASKAPLPDRRDLLNGAWAINGLLYVPGGQNAAGQPTATLFVYNPSTNSWSTRAPMPAAGGCGASGVIGGKLYVYIPGCTSVSPAFMRYDPATNQWQPLPLPPSYHRSPAAGVARGRFYLIGGQIQTGFFSYANEEFDPATNTWRVRRESPEPRYGAAGAVVDGLVYILAGYGNLVAKTALAYDPLSDVWQNSPLPLSFARGSLAAAAVNGKLYALGGADNIQTLAVNEAYTPGNIWVTKTPMSVARGSLVAVVASGKLYAVGGFNGAKLAVNQMYTVSTDRWTNRASLPQVRIDANGAGIINGVLYVPGGSNGVYTKTLYAYNLSTNSWATKAPSPAAGGRGASGVIGGRLYVYSGADATFASAKRLDRYDPATNAWKTMAPPLSIHDQPAAGVINGKFYLAGGRTSAGNTTALEAYDPAVNAWTPLAPMPTARRAATGVVLNGLLYVIGGLSDGLFVLGTVEVYNPNTNSWRTLSPLPTRAFTLAAGAVSGKIYVIGGYGASSGTSLSNTQVYTP